MAYTAVIIFCGIYLYRSFWPFISKVIHDLGFDYEVPDSSFIPTFFAIIITAALFYFISKLLPSLFISKKAGGVESGVISLLFLSIIIFLPPAMLLNSITNTILRMAGVMPSGETKKVIEEEIRSMVDEGGEKGSLEQDEIAMINNIFEFNDKTAEEIATHRTDINSIDAYDSFDKIIKTLAQGSHSRWPVYEGSIDNIIGILYVRDILKYIVISDVDTSNISEFSIRDLIREPYFVPTSKKADELFKEMQANKIHMSIVLDEYGGMIGIVTMEDLIEEVMGNIFDEYDDEEPPEIEIQSDGSYLISGSASLGDIRKELDLDMPEDEYDTAAGFFVGQLRRIPDEQETPEVEYKGFIFKALEMEDKRITRIYARKIT